MKNRIVVYTCITGGYDQLLEPRKIDPGTDYVCVTDVKYFKESIWKCMHFKSRYGNALDSRFIKMHPHILFPDYDISVYVDGNIEIKSDLSQMADEAVKRHSVAMYDHPFRDCIYEEALECSAIGHDWCWRIGSQMKRYQREGFPRKSGLFECNIIIRKHGEDSCKKLMSLWWDELHHGVKRDQLSLAYSAWKCSTPIHNMGPSDARGEKEFFSLDKIHTQDGIGYKLRKRVNEMILKMRKPNEL